MKEIIKSIENTIDLKNSPVTQKKFNQEIDKKTKEYQKIYGFEISSDPIHPTWNNEADAFKHAYMSAILAIRYDSISSRLGGIKHELKNLSAKNPKNETNMDLWNNEIGYKIAKEVKEELKFLKGVIPEQHIEDLVAKKIMEKMKKGELITTPTDSRAKTIADKIQGSIKGKVTGFAENIDRVFTPEEIAKMTSDEFIQNEHEIMEQLKGGQIKQKEPNFDFKNFTNEFSEEIFTAEQIGAMSQEEFTKKEAAINYQLKNVGIPKEYQVKESIKSGDLTWVKSYNRADGTTVKGYYRKTNQPG